VAIISALAEGSSIRSIERITGVHRDTILRLGVRIGKGCAKVQEYELRNLPCRHWKTVAIAPVAFPILAVRTAIF